MIVLPYRTRHMSGSEFRPAHEYTIMFKLAGGDYYHVPAAQVRQICPELQATIEKAVQDGTAMTDVFEVPHLLEQDWKDWWTINDYIAQARWKGELVWVDSSGEQAPGASQQDVTNGLTLTTHPNNTGCELTTYEPISSFLTDARVHILATQHGLDAAAEAAAAATQDRAAEILDCITDTESLFDTREALFHLESLVAAARLACQWEEEAGPAVGRMTRTWEQQPLPAMADGACTTLGPLLAELPALREAVAADARFAALWEDIKKAKRATVELTPEVKERMRWVVESCEV